MNRAGNYVNNLSGKLAYKSFKPSFLPLTPELTISPSTNAKLLEAYKYLLELEGISKYIPNKELFISMYVRKEALLSSQIEGTQCTLEDILNPAVDINANQDVSDVINYIDACLYAIKRIESLPICCRLIKETHEKLMAGVRGQEKSPGDFRKSQNWIGGSGSTISEARYIPPNVEDMIDAMTNLEKFINDDGDIDPLIKNALVHYQFETIHPFLDGNGRIGRLLIMLMLLDSKILSSPILYVSYFLKKNQIEYYDRMSEVRNSGNYEQWIFFFLEAICEASKDAITTIENINKLHEINIKKLPETNRKINNVKVLFDYIEKYPIIDIQKTAKALNMSYNTVSNSINKLIELKVLKKGNDAARNRIYIYDKYLQILRKDT
ncbi:MAG: Fic family protein [Firmicutes bacterium]|nr:Fic family protein [Candidatus Colivicinus equi]